MDDHEILHTQNNLMGGSNTRLVSGFLRPGQAIQLPSAVAVLFSPGKGKVLPKVLIISQSQPGIVGKRESSKQMTIFELEEADCESSS